MVLVLEREGAEVIAVSSAFEVLQVLIQTKPYVLVSDTSMPDMDAYMVIRHLRMLTPEAGGKIPPITLTAYARDDDQKQALQVTSRVSNSFIQANAEKLVTAVVKLVATGVQYQSYG